MIAPPQIAVRVRDIEPLSPTLKRFSIEAADGRPMPVSSAGSHLVLTLKGPDRTWKNAYSVVSVPGGRQVYQIVVRRVPNSRGGSVYLHDAVKVGDLLHASAPHNLFPLMATARKHVMVGGGIGVTPFIAQLAQLRKVGGAPYELHQFVVADDVPIFERLLGVDPNVHIHVHPGPVSFDMAAMLGRQPLGTHLYVCGPGGFMDMVMNAATALGWPHSAVHHESFGDHSSGTPFTAVLAKSTIEIEVGAGQSLLEAMEQAGVDAPYLCRGGACGQCMTRVIDGEPDHRDDVLTDEERAAGEYIMTCVSRAKTPRLVLDI